MLDYLRDIEADFAAFYGIQIDIDSTTWDGWGRISAARFFRLAYRLPAYEGALRARLAAEREQDGPPTGGQPREPEPVAVALTPEMAARGVMFGDLAGIVEVVQVQPQ